MDMNFGSAPGEETFDQTPPLHFGSESQTNTENPRPAATYSGIVKEVSSENPRPYSATISNETLIQSAKTVQRRRRWTPQEKRAIVEEIERQGMSTSAVARKYGISLRLVFSWRRNMRQELLSSVSESSDSAQVADATEATQLKSRIQELERILGKKLMENQLLKEALESARIQVPQVSGHQTTLSVQTD